MSADEQRKQTEEPGDRWTTKEWLLLFADTPRTLYYVFIQGHLNKAFVCLRYMMLHPGRRKKTVMHIETEVQRWCDILAGLCRSHAPEPHDQADYQIDDIYLPLLNAPVKQVREFAEKLADALETDERIPYIIWRPYVELLRGSLQRIEPSQMVELKTQLAREIAEAVEKDIQPQLADALIGALQWRAESTLKKVKEAVESGEKPKLTGRQSCLFLECGGERIML